MILFHFCPDCYYLGCEHLCVEVLPGVKGCQCEQGYQLGPDRQSCIAKGSVQRDNFARYAIHHIYIVYLLLHNNVYNPWGFFLYKTIIDLKSKF